MRSIFAISLAVMAGGCGDNLGDAVDDVGDNDLSEVDGVLDDGLVAKLVPQVCATREWSNVFYDAKDADLAVVPMPLGAAVLSVPKVGGNLRGFLIDGRGLVMGSPLGTKILSGAFTSVSATRIDDRLVVGVSDGDAVTIDLVRDDLGATYELASEPGSVIGNEPVLHARGDRVTTLGGSGGLVATTFDGNWDAVSSEVIARSVPTYMSSTSYGGDAMIAWSTESDCNIQRVAAGLHSQISHACEGAQLAMSYEDGAGLMVYEGGESIWASRILIGSHNEFASEHVLTPNGEDPRVVFDGERFWVSYVSAHGSIVAGYIDEDGALTATSVGGVRPINGSYELAIINNSVWIVAIDATDGFSAARMCLVRGDS